MLLFGISLRVSCYNFKCQTNSFTNSFMCIPNQILQNQQYFEPTPADTFLSSVLEFLKINKPATSLKFVTKKKAFMKGPQTFEIRYWQEVLYKPSAEAYLQKRKQILADPQINFYIILSFLRPFCHLQNVMMAGSINASVLKLKPKNCFKA